MLKLLLGTNNPGKLREFQMLFQGLPWRLVTPEEAGVFMTVEETGNTYEENARTKALAYARASRLVSLADDSGLEVDALSGLPGINSARFGGRTTDRSRVEYLLSLMKDIPPEKRSARFVCIIAIATPEGRVDSVRGECYGFITMEPRGESGFGYDPVFYFPELGKTLAELPLDIKNRVSHRGKAAREAYRLLERLAREAGI